MTIDNQTQPQFKSFLVFIAFGTVDIPVVVVIQSNSTQEYFRIDAITISSVSRVVASTHTD